MEHFFYCHFLLHRVVNKKSELTIFHTAKSGVQSTTRICFLLRWFPAYKTGVPKKAGPVKLAIVGGCGDLLPKCITAVLGWPENLFGVAGADLVAVPGRSKRRSRQKGRSADISLRNIIPLRRLSSGLIECWAGFQPSMGCLFQFL